MEPPVLILASASPRRSDLLGRTGVAFEVIPADIPEERRKDEGPRDFALRLAAEKARAVATRVGPTPGRRVLGADTIVVVDDLILGKPTDEADAERMLSLLTGRSHDVITAIALTSTDAPGTETRAVCSQVRMHAATAAEIRDYVALGESLDKAGAYALQGEGRRFVASVDGSETNVIGLPVEETLALLALPVGPGKR
jgi:septum formation protein